MVLEGLDAIEWDKLSHAYGSAENIPDLLRALDNTDNDEDFYKLTWDLWSYINHQGDHYDSTPACVPFLFQILRNKQDILQKLDTLISIGELLRTLNYSASSDSTEFKTYYAVVDEIEYLLKLLTEENLQVRLGSIYVLSFLNREAEKILPMLETCIQYTDDEYIQASSIWVYAQLVKAFHSSKENYLSQLDKWIESSSLVIRYAAAFGYLSIATPSPIPDHIITLVDEEITTEDWPVTKGSSKELNYLFSELMPFLDVKMREELRKLLE